MGACWHAFNSLGLAPADFAHNSSFFKAWITVEALRCHHNVLWDRDPPDVPCELVLWDRDPPLVPRDTCACEVFAASMARAMDDMAVRVICGRSHIIEDLNADSASTDASDAVQQVATTSYDHAAVFVFFPPEIMDEESVNDSQAVGDDVLPMEAQQRLVNALHEATDTTRQFCAFFPHMSIGLVTPLVERVYVGPQHGFSRPIQIFNFWGDSAF